MRYFSIIFKQAVRKYKTMTALKNDNAPVDILQVNNSLEPLDLTHGRWYVSV
jgi:hypothetical protein